MQHIHNALDRTQGVADSMRPVGDLNQQKSRDVHTVVAGWQLFSWIGITHPRGSEQFLCRARFPELPRIDGMTLTTVCRQKSDLWPTLPQLTWSGRIFPPTYS